jgi:hypothetical protein
MTRVTLVTARLKLTSYKCISLHDSVYICYICTRCNFLPFRAPRHRLGVHDCVRSFWTAFSVGKTIIDPFRSHNVYFATFGRQDSVGFGSTQTPGCDYVGALRRDTTVDTE